MPKTHTPSHRNKQTASSKGKGKSHGSYGGKSYGGSPGGSKKKGMTPYKAKRR